MQVVNPLDQPVSLLKLSVRSLNCLRESKIDTIRQLIQKTPAELLKIKNFGKKSLNEIQIIIKEMGFDLGMPNIPQVDKLDLQSMNGCIEVPKDIDIDPNSYKAIIFPVYEKVRSVRIDELPFSARTLRCFSQHKVIYIQDLTKLNISDVLKWRNFGKKSMTDSMIVLKEYIDFLENQKESLVTDSSEEIIKNIQSLLDDKKYYIFSKRITDHSEDKETLEQLAKKFKLTRERVRQIESKIIGIIKKNCVGIKIRSYIQLIYNFVESKGGIAKYDELLNESLKEPHAKIDHLRALLGFNNLISDKKIYLIKLNGNIVFSLDDTKTLETAYKELTNEVVQYYGFTIDQLQEALQLDVSYSQLIEDLSLDRFIKEEGIFREGKLIGIKGEHLKNIDYFYLSYGKSLHDKQVKDEYDKIYGNNLSSTSLRGLKDRSENLLLWGRGEYIHKALISINENALEKVYEKIRQAVMNHEKKTSSIAIFNENPELMEFLGVPTPQALYSVLRMQENEQYLYRKYPDIEHSANSKFSRVERDDEVEKYFIAQNKDLFLDELRGYFVNKRGLIEYQLLFAIDRCLDIYKLGNNRWIHAKLPKLSRAKITKIVQESKAALHGNRYMLLSDLIETVRLPDISPYRWNRTLLSSILRKNSELKLILNIAIVSSDTSGIKTIEDLVVDIVKSNPNQFSRQTLSLYLKSKKITTNPNFLGGFFEKYGFLFERINAI